MSAALAKQVRHLPVLLPTGKPVNASMSKTDLLLMCQWWASPRTARPKEFGDKSRLNFGIAFHKCMELWLLCRAINFKQIATRYNTDAKRLEHFFRRAKEFVLKMLKKRGWESERKLLEQKVAYDPFRNTARLLVSSKERDYSGLKTTELPGTGDLAILPRDMKKPFVILDYKTGTSDYDAKGNGQLKSLGSSLALLENRPQAIGIILRIDEDFIEPYEAPYGPKQWEEHREVLKAALREALSPHPPMRPGEHCAGLYCPALEICPSQAGPLGLGDRMHLVENRDQLGPIFEQYRAAKKLLERLGERFAEEIRMNGPFMAEDGYATLVPKSKSNLSMASIRRAMGDVDGNKVIEYLEENECIEKSEWEEVRVVGEDKLR